MADFTHWDLPERPVQRRPLPDIAQEYQRSKPGDDAIMYLCLSIDIWRENLDFSVIKK
jgi:hypothetical protein